MSGGENWCGAAFEHGGHWLQQRVRCDGVSRDEAVVMAVSLDDSYSGLSRDEARRVIDALDKARGE